MMIGAAKPSFAQSLAGFVRSFAVNIVFG